VLSLGIGNLVRELDTQARRMAPTLARKALKKTRGTDGHLTSA
jgi:hypothetical protein